MSFPHNIKNLSQQEIDAISRILRHRKLDEYQKLYGMSSADFQRRWNAGELAASFDFNHWARLLAQEAPPPLVTNEPPVDPDDTREFPRLDEN